MSDPVKGDNQVSQPTATPTDNTVAASQSEDGVEDFWANPASLSGRGMARSALFDTRQVRRPTTTTATTTTTTATTTTATTATTTEGFSAYYYQGCSSGWRWRNG